MLPAQVTAVVRPITHHDASAVAQVHAASWRSAYRGMLQDEFLDGDLAANRLALWTRRLDPMPAAHFGYLCVEDKVATGFAFAFGSHDPIRGTQIDNLHVLPDHKGRGIGRRLLRALCVESERRRPGGGLYLWVYEQNLPARRFYEGLGGTPADSMSIQSPGGGRVMELRYAWRCANDLLAALQSGAALPGSLPRT